MPKVYCTVGYAETVETRPGVWTEQITERNYYGDMITNRRKMSQGENTVNQNVVVNNDISILADPYAYQHFSSMRYVRWSGVNWKISNVEVQYPRLLLSIGEVFNA